MKIKIFDINIVFNPLILPIILIIAFTGQLSRYMTVFLCAFIHEISHIAFARKYGIRVDSIEILPVGLVGNIAKFSYLPLFKEVILYAVGPAANIFLAFIAYGCKMVFNNYNMWLVDEFILINILLASLNLLPIFPLDGGRILNSIMRSKKSLKSANECIRISKIAVLILLVPALLMCVFTGNFSFFMICIFILIYIAKYGDSIKAEPLINLMNKREILKTKMIHKTEVISVQGSTYLFDLIKEFKLSSFYIIMVLDDEMKTIGIVNEADIINFVIENSISVKLHDLIAQD